MSIISKKINYLSKNNYDVTIFPILKHEQSFYKIANNVSIVDVDVKSGIKSKILSFIKFIKNNKFDIIISADALYITWILPYITKTPTVIEIHQSYDGLIEFHKRSSFLNLWIHKLMYKMVYPKYNRMVVLTEEDKLKWRYKNIVIIPNFHSINQDVVNKPQKKIVCVGRFQHQKGYDLMIEIWKKIYIQYPDWQLFYYGVEPNAFTKSEMKKYNAPDSIKIMGTVNNIDEIYSDAYINIVPSRSESFSLSILESMCYGVPSVSFDITGPKSLITNKKDGVIIKSFNVEYAASAIINLINNVDYRNKLAENCLKTSEKYSQTKIMQKWIQLFNSL